MTNNRRCGGAVAIACGVLVLAGCFGHDDAKLRAIKARGTLLVITRNAPTTYYIGREDEPTGPEHDMAAAFASSLGVKVDFIVEDTVAGMLRALAAGKGDLVAGGITRTATREASYAFGPDYQTVTQQVVCRRGGNIARTVDELAGVKLSVVSDSSYVERLKALQADHPKLHWMTSPTSDTEDLLRDVWQGKLDCTVADSDIVAINRRFFPNLVIAFDLSEPQQLAWVIPSDAAGLRSAMRDWFSQYRQQGDLHRLMQRYYAHVQVFDYVDIRTFVRRIKSRYPRYRDLFHQAAKRENVPPLILAAQSYQESHWNAHAKSPTGVRGMMMLTLPTARSVGVRNRLNAQASINGGARYLARIERRLSDSIDEKDRIWFALAAYNIGYGHLQDARELAGQLGRDPDNWSAIRTVLPLLSERTYYHKLDHGYARGLEAVRYVRRIRNYSDILREKTSTASIAANRTRVSSLGRSSQ